MKRGEVRVGSRINLATHTLTRSQGVKGTGVVTVASPALVIVKTKAGYLHCPRQAPFNPYT